jgi:hypothetical protein
MSTYYLCEQDRQEVCHDQHRQRGLYRETEPVRFRLGVKHRTPNAGTGTGIFERKVWMRPVAYNRL